MNKRFIYILVIIVLLAGICVWEQTLESKYLNVMETKVTNVITQTSELENINNSTVFELIEDMETTWNGYEENLCFFVNLKDVEDIGIELTKLKIYVVENSVTEFKASLSLLLFYIDSYYNLMGISLNNIF